MSKGMGKIIKKCIDCRAEIKDMKKSAKVENGYICDNCNYKHAVLEDMYSGDVTENDSYH